MENTQPKPQENKTESKPQNQPANQPVKPFEKLFTKPEEKSFNKSQDLRPGTPPVKPADQKPGNPGSKQLEKTDDRPYVAWAGAALLVLAILFYGYNARQEGVVNDMEEETTEQAGEETEGTEEAESTSRENEEEVSTPASVATPQPTTEVRTFNSEDLGVTFTYPASFTVREEGNRIFLESANLPTRLAMEVFEKDEDVTLSEAVEREFRANLNSANCSVVEMPGNSAMPGHVKVGIYNGAVGAEAATTQCGPAGWSNRDSYFLMNTEAPEKFVAVYGTAGNVTVGE